MAAPIPHAYLKGILIFTRNEGFFDQSNLIVVIGLYLEAKVQKNPIWLQI